jgi:Tol biopolymer transport system component
MYNGAEYTLRGVGDLSPDRRRTAMWRRISGSEWDGKPSTREIFVANVHGQFGRAVATVRGMSPRPVWASDGRKIAYGTWSERLPSFPYECHERWIVKSDGTDPQHVANARGFSWGPDAHSYVLAEGCRVGEPHELVLHLPSGERRVLAQGHSTGVVWAPGGRLYAYQTLREEIVIARLDGVRVLRVLPRAIYPAWSPDGRRIAFIRRAREGAFAGDLMIANADGTKVKTLVRAKDRTNAPNSLAWSPDGRRIAYTRERYRVAEVIGATGRNRRVLVRGGSISRLWWSRDSRKLYYTGIE